MTEEKIQSINLDANEAVFFARQLEMIKAQTYDKRYPELKATRLLPVSTNGGAGSRTITYQQFDQVGLAKIIANYADDLPRSDIKGQEFSAIVKSIGGSYGYSVQEIRAAQMAGLPLEQRKANAARRAVEQKINQIAFFGDAENKLVGFLNNPNIPTSTVPADGTGSSTLFVNKTPSQIVRDMNNLANGIFERTKGVEQPTTLLMPLEQYSYISTTQFSTASDVSILNFFLSNQPFITEVEWVNELKGAGTGGADIMVAYNPDADKLTLELPIPFEQFPAQEKGLEFIVPVHSRIAGCLVYYPLSAAFADGI